MTVFALNLHAGFQCRRSGACCTAGWPIPVEREIADAILGHGVLPGTALTRSGRLPDGAVAVLAPDPGAACPAFDAAGGNACAIQRQLGHRRLPAACRHFPRVALVEPDAVRVTLSHFCPTAASMLFRPDASRLAIVPDAAGISDRDAHEGFDARLTIPPLLRPGVAFDAPTCRIWERFLLDVFDQENRKAEGMLADAAAVGERLRCWTTGRGPLASYARTVVADTAAKSQKQQWAMSVSDASRFFLLAAESVPLGLARPALPADVEALDRERVMPTWSVFSRPLGRYLAARSFASWSAYLGDGLRTQISMLAVALAAVRIEAARQAATARRPLDEALLLEAIRAADLLLHHLSDTRTLVRSLAGVERGPTAAFLEATGLAAVA